MYREFRLGLGVAYLMGVASDPARNEFKFDIPVVASPAILLAFPISCTAPNGCPLQILQCRHRD